MTNTEINSKNQSKWHALIIWIIFLLFFSGLFMFEVSVGELWPIWDITSLKIKDIFEKFHIYGWIIVAFLSTILFFILNIFTRYIKNHKAYFQLFLVSISLLPWYIFANQLVYHENRYADFAKATISYFGYPLLVTIEDFIVLLITITLIVQIILFLKYIILWKILRKK